MKLNAYAYGAFGVRIWWVITEGDVGACTHTGTVADYYCPHPPPVEAQLVDAVYVIMAWSTASNLANVSEKLKCYHLACVHRPAAAQAKSMCAHGPAGIRKPAH